MTIRFDIPAELEQVLATAGNDTSLLMKEAALLEMYRRGSLTHHQLGQALGLHRFETDALLKRYGIPLDLTVEELEAQRRAMAAVVGR